MTVLDETEGDVEEISPWTDIWFSPRRTIDWVISNNYSLLTVGILIYLGGVHYGISQAELKNLGDTKETGSILVTCLFLSGLGGLVFYNLWIWAIDFCSMWFGGKGNFKKTQAAFAWSMMPIVIGLSLSVISYILFEDEMFTSYTPTIENNQFLAYTYWGIGTLEAILGIWHFALLVITVSQVQQFSAIRSFASIVSGILILLVPVIGLIMLM
jgi:hypothetical protein